MSALRNITRLSGLVGGSTTSVTAPTAMLAGRLGTRHSLSTNLSQPKSLSPELAELLGVPKLSRLEVTKKLWQYIHKNSLQDKVDKRMINCDAKLEKVLKTPKLSMFEMTKVISQNHIH